MSIFFDSIPRFSLVVTGISILIVAIDYFFPLKVSIEPRDAKDLLATTASLSGVFLGLYFTAISVVAGNLFSKLTQDVRDLFSREKVGNQYIWILSFTTLLSVFYLALISMGFVINSAIIIFVAFLSAYNIIHIVVLNLRSFLFFDPTVVDNLVLSKVYKFIKSSSTKSFFWSDRNFQNFFNQEATKNILTFRRLVEFALKSPDLFEKQLYFMAGKMMVLLRKYLQFKKKIPSGSLWYKTKQEFQYWMLADSMEVSMALNTGTTLRTKETRNHFWIEEECLSIFSLIVEFLIEKGKILSAYNSFDFIIDTATKVGYEMEKDVASLLVLETRKIVDPIYIESIEDNKKERMALVDSHGRVAIALLLGAVSRVENLNYLKFQQLLSKINWKKKKTIYKGSFPLALLQDLELLFEQLNYEFSVNGEVTSPAWYREMLLINNYLYKTNDFLDYLMSLNEILFTEGVSTLLEKKQSILAAQLVQRWIEFLDKFRNLLSTLEKKEPEFEVAHKFEDLKWGALNLKQRRRDLKSYRIRSIEFLAELIPSLSLLKRQKDMPDYFGHAYTFVLESCYRAAAYNDASTFRKLFPLVFIGSHVAFEKMKEEVKGWTPESQAVFISEPIMDILELSGYAKIYSELYDAPDMWRVCKGSWNVYLDGEIGGYVLNSAFALANIRKGTFSIKPKDMIRMEWERIFKSIMHKKGLMRIEPHYRFSGEDQEPGMHKSKLISKLGRRGAMLRISASELFLVGYLSKHEKAKSIKSELIETFRKEFYEEMDEEDYWA